VTRQPLAPAAIALFRLLAERAGLPPDRTLLSAVETVEWRSLTLSGERHLIGLRLTGADAARAAAALCDGLEDAELPMRGLFVADIAVERPVKRSADGAFDIRIEALTIRD
jgi:hypothetical protein